VNVNRGLVFWGVALITAGIVALAIQSGIIAGDSARQLWRLWPVVLIVIGLAVIAARTPFALVTTLAAGLIVGGMAGTLVSGLPDGMNIGCGGEPAEGVTDAGSFAGDTASVEIDFSCGDLSVATQPGPEWGVEARYGGGTAPRISSAETSLQIGTDEGGGPFGFSERRQAWDVILPTDVDLDLTVDANAASSDLDLDDGSFSSLAIDANAGEVALRLAGASVDEFSLDANAGSMSIEVDAETILAGSVEMNAGSLELCIPDSVAVALTIEDDNITFSHDLDEGGLERQGDTWRGGGGTAAVTLEISGNAASLSLNPEEGCS
jgi:hypothetical protein